MVCINQAIPILALNQMNRYRPKNVTMVVLGDIGRSPRMQYHALSLAKAGHVVDLIGYGETEPSIEVKCQPNIYYHYLLSPPVLPVRLVNYIFKTLWQAINLLFLLLFTRRTHVLLVQNPPAIPALTVCLLYCKLVRAKYVIDWHNYAHTIMALSVGKHNRLVWGTEKIEAMSGRLADANFCVTKAMKEDLQSRWRIPATILYDKPLNKFRPISLEEKHSFLQNFAKEYSQLMDKDGSSVFTEIVGNTVKLKPNRPGLIVSSTSWTEDEDFSILLAALQAYESVCQSGNLRGLPKLVCVITGKGPLQQHYRKQIELQKWQYILVITPWFMSNEYPLMLASADLGVSLHVSSSGLDLPMKVVDMFGCELPVCAYNFECLHELVKDGENGYTFSTSNELTMQLQDWFEDFPENSKQKVVDEKFRQWLHDYQRIRWAENWTRVAASVFE